MTVGVAVRGEDGIWVASDTQVDHMRMCKIMSGPREAILFSGDLEAYTVLRYETEWCAASPQEFYEVLKNLWGHKRLRKGKSEWELLIVLGRSLYYADSNGAFFEHDESELAIGSGSAYALGSLCETVGESTQMRVVKAVKAACKRDPSCSLPVDREFIAYEEE